jgi:hypothetical protein
MKKYELKFVGNLERIIKADEDDTEESIDNDIEDGYINFDDQDMATFLIDGNTVLTVKDENNNEIFNSSLESFQSEVKNFKLPEKYIINYDVFELKFEIELSEKFNINELKLNKLGKYGFDMFSIQYTKAMKNNEIIDWDCNFDFNNYLSTWDDGYEVIGFDCEFETSKDKDIYLNDFISPCVPFTQAKR